MKKSLALVAALVLAAFGLTALNRRRAAEKLPEAAPAGAERERIQTFWNTYNQANALRLRAAYSEAVPVYQECLRLNPQHEDSLYYLGDCQEETGDYAAAATSYRKLIEINAASARAFAELGNTLSTVAPGALVDFSQARDAYERCIRLNREQAGPFLRLGALELNQGRYQKALDDFHLAAGFGSAEGNYLAGYTLFLQGKYRAALDPLEKVVNAYAKDRKLSGRGVVSEGDLLPAPDKPLTALEKAGVKSILLLYWTAERLGGYPAEIPQEFRVTRPLPGDVEVTAVNVGISGTTLPAGRVVWSDADPQGRRFAAVVAPGQPVRLFRRAREGGALTEVTDSSGLKGVRDAWDAVWADYDRDGYPDLYLVRSGFTGIGRNTLYHNQRDGTFADVTSAAGLAGERATTRACFADLTGDGRLDLLEVGASVASRSSVRLFRNTGRRFVDQTEATGLASTGTAVDCAVADTSRSGRLDVFVLFWRRDAVLFQNQGNGRFSNVTQQSGLQGIRGTGYSALFFDYNRDGFPDLLVTSHAPAEDAARSLLDPGYRATQVTPRLFRNKRGAGFEEVTAQVGLTRAYGTMQAVAVDFDLDGWPDLLLVNGSLDRERLEPSVLLRNIQGREFREWSYLPDYDHPSNFVAASTLRDKGGRLTILPAASPALSTTKPSINFTLQPNSATRKQRRRAAGLSLLGWAGKLFASTGTPGSDSLHLLQIQRNSDAIHQDNTTIDQVLVGDLGVTKFAELRERANKLQSLRQRRWSGLQLVDDSDIESGDSRILGDVAEDWVQKRGQEEIEALGSPLINRRRTLVEGFRVPKGQLEVNSISKNYERGRCIIHEMEPRYAYLTQRLKLGPIILLKRLRVRLIPRSLGRRLI